MSLTRFEPFPRLPQELRSEIWLAAMPEPRLVRLQEHVTEAYNEEEYNTDLYTNLYSAPEMVDAIDQVYLDCSDEEYAEEEWDPLRICHARTSIPSLYKIDPGLQHFNQAWKYPNKPEGKLQTQLEKYGFTSTQAKPELPLHLLTDCRNMYEVYEATRRGHIWSSCPIPALLHTCRESRSTMKRAGYELTFGHRTSKPRVWFNFRHDTLYLSVPQSWELDEHLSSRSLDQGLWNIGQLSPAVLVRVERLALGNVYDFREDCQSHAIRLFGNLKEVLLVRHHRSTKPMKELLDPYYEPETGEDRWGHVETEHSLWRCLDYTVADLFSTRWVDRDSRNFRDLQSHLRSGGVESGYWPSVAGKIGSFLQQQQEWAVVCGVTPWVIPKVHIVQVVTKGQQEDIAHDREEYARRNDGVPPAPPLPER
ncbi:uncharacterized protein PAC_14918 [Phialocephala subalpina]|uniref:2EXR domain-containing protein n=1 Tax=Phialocephala subalpina TaxID=576137 RepID=A0A1L7XJ28_9HELO|nr:uncharacterized protein PAC_14918 [Phialocephala subalpina]